MAPPAGMEIPFELIDTNSRTIRAPTCAGVGCWSFSDTRYTSCPDLCPTAPSDIAEALAQLGPFAARVQPVFVSLDPERDTPQALHEYALAFDERILALTGTADQLANAAKSLASYSSRFRVPHRGSTPSRTARL